MDISSLDMGSLLGKVGDMKAKLEEAQKQASQITASATVGGDMVTVVANGKQELVRVQIHASAWEMGDRAMLEDLVVAAANQALKQSKDKMQEEMQKIMRQAGLPSLPGFDLSRSLL